MVNSDFNESSAERKGALERLKEDCERFWANTDAGSYTMPELIDRFLKSSDPSQSEHYKLIFFRLEVADYIGWSGYSQVNEYIIANDPGSINFTYESWITYGREVMKDAMRLSLEERIRVAADVEAIIERAVKEADYDPEQSLAWFYYEHPLKLEQPQLYLLKSKEWFERFVKTEYFNDQDYHDLQMLGHVYFELGDFKTALYWYEKLETTDHRCDKGCILDRALAERRLVECQHRVSESGD